MSLKRLSPLRYPGGKSKILDYIIKIVEKNNLINSEYVEPYAGGAGVALGLLIGGYVSKIHINDIDIGIHAFWNEIINNTDNFIKKIKDTPICIEEWEKQRNIYLDLDSFSDLEKGFATFFLNRCNRSGIVKGGCIGGKNQSGEYKLNARFNKENLIQRIETIASFRDKINVYNQDTLNLLKEKKTNFKNAIIYLDPPYYEKGYCLYKNHYKHVDHVNIAKAVRKLNGHWIVSYDNVPEIIDIYSDIPRREFNISYSAGKTKKGKEIMFFSNNINIPTCPITGS